MDYNNTETYPLSDIIDLFRAKYKNYSYATFDGRTMRKILNGDLIIVNKSGTRKFELWTKEDILSGKLEKLNQQIKLQNKLNKVQAKQEYDKLLARNPELAIIINLHKTLKFIK